MEAFYYALIPIMLGTWALIAYAWWKGMGAEYLDEMGPYAAIACFASFLFTGPFCLVIWASFIYRGLWLSLTYKFERPKEHDEVPSYWVARNRMMDPGPHHPPDASMPSVNATYRRLHPLPPDRR